MIEILEEGKEYGGRMKIVDESEFKHMVSDILRECVTDYYYKDVLDVIYDDVKEDVECCADENYNDTDVKYSIGRILLEKLNKLPF